MADATPRDPDRAAILAATLGAAAMIAQQVGGKATRDAIFLANFDVAVLPRMLALSALLAIPVVLGTAKALGRYGPQRVVPASFVASAAILFGLWLLSPHAPRAVAVLLYLHLSSFGAILVSGFWSLLNERFDPRTARQRFRRVASGGTIGGLAGGILAAGLGRFAGGGAAMLPLLAVFHLICVWTLHRVLAQTRATGTGQTEPLATSLTDGIKVLARVPYLRDLGLLVVLGTLGAACLDYVFKASAQSAFGGGDHGVDLITFFGIFYTALSLLTLLLQTGLSRWCLEELGLARTVATLPASVVLGSLAAIFVPVWPLTSAARGLEGGVRSSLYRSGYEPLYTPLAPGRKRASKTIIDVGLERAGDALGGGLVQVVVWLTSGAILAYFQERVLLGFAIGFGLAGLWITRRLHHGYVGALERSLLSRVIEVDEAKITDATTRTMVMQTLGGMELPTALRRDADADGDEEGMAPVPAAPASRRSDPLTRTISKLRSGEPQRVLRTLAQQHPLAPELAAHVVPLLAWDAVAESALACLRSGGARVTGLLLDALLDPEEEFTIRRRIPRALTPSDSPLLLYGLLEALGAERFEIRYQCGLALARLHEAHPRLRMPETRIHAVLMQEARVDRRVWESHRLLDPSDEGSPFLDEVLRRRSNRSLEHVFTLLSLLLPKQPLLLAYRGLMTEDRSLRGTALEYLETVLPAAVRDTLWPLLDAPSAPPPEVDPRERERRLDELLRSNQSIQINLDDLRRRQAQLDAASEPPSTTDDLNPGANDS